jgi:hypothetical protein
MGPFFHVRHDCRAPRCGVPSAVLSPGKTFASMADFVAVLAIWLSVIHLGVMVLRSLQPMQADRAECHVAGGGRGVASWFPGGCRFRKIRWPFRRAGISREYVDADGVVVHP